MACLNTAKIRFTLFEEGVYAFEAIFRLEAVDLQADFFVELLFKQFTVVADQRALDIADREPGRLRKLFGHLHGLFFELCRWKNAVDDAETQSVFRT